MRILLCTLNVKSSYSPLALLYLKSMVLNDTYAREICEVSIYEFTLKETNEYILSQIKDFQPQIIAFSCYVWNIEKILSISSKLKTYNNNIKIILGGPQVSSIAEEILLENAHIDFIIRGEGEITFLELIKSLLGSKKDLCEIDGISYRHNGKITNNKERENIKDLDSIPSPFTIENNLSSYTQVCIETQRGCAFNCYYCYYNKAYKNIRYFSMERVKRDLSFLLNQKLESVYLMDPTFNFNKKRAKEICRFIGQNNKNNISFHTEINAELMDEELAELFYEANIKFLEIGLQSTNEKVLKLCNRKLDIHKFISGINILKKYKVPTETQLILGLPGQTEGSFKKSLDFVLDLNSRFLSGNLSVFMLQVLPGTVFWEKAEELGIFFNSRPPYNFLHSKPLPLEKVAALNKLINAINLFQNMMALKMLSKEINLKILDIIEQWIEWLGRDSELLINIDNRNKAILLEKISKFITHLCEQNNLDLKFYKMMLKKEINKEVNNAPEPHASLPSAPPF